MKAPLLISARPGGSDGDIVAATNLGARKRTAKKWTATRVDLVFGSNVVLRVYATHSRFCKTTR